MINLKNVLLINGISSGASGLILALLPGVIAEVFEVPNTSVFVGVGISLLLFSFFVIYVAIKFPIRHGLVKIISFLDISWVAASFTLVAFQPAGISITGSIIVLAVALWVALMAYLQIKNLDMAGINKAG